MSLEHPLPAGMRDLLPNEAHAQSELARRVMHAFELAGFERVSVPAFEYAEVLERGLGALSAEEVLRFVEPETGEVVALRPDMTPQLARLYATRLSELPLPCRLCYEGSVLRRPRARARRHRQTPQAGIELIGSAAPAGDVEVVTVASLAVRAAGLERFVIDLGHARVAGSLIERAPEHVRRELVEALSLKDAAELARRAERVGLAAEITRALAALVDLCGPASEVFARAHAVLAGSPAERPLAELEQLCAALAARAVAHELVVDLGETRNFAYYTGVMFQILAEGPGAAVGSGGRYDGLLAKFATPRPAAGFALDLDNLGWALSAAGVAPSARVRVLVSGATDEMLSALRARGIACAPAPAEASLEYARTWRYSHWIELGQAPVLIAIGPGSRHPLSARTDEALAKETAQIVASLAPGATPGPA